MNNSNKNNGVVAIITILSFVFALFFEEGGLGALLVVGGLGVILVGLQKSDYLPALVFLCSIGDSSANVIFIAMMFVCVANGKVLYRDKHTKLLFIILLLMLPLFIMLVVQRVYLDGDRLPWALAYAQYYLSFWGFLYFYITATSFRESTVRIIFYLLVSAILINNLELSTMKINYRLVLFGYCSLAVLCILQFFTTKRMIWGGLLIIDLLLIGLSYMSFTKLLFLLLACVIGYLAYKQKEKLLYFLGRFPIFIVWVLLMASAINNYSIVDVTSDAKEVTFDDYQSFMEYFQFKLFQDRAPYWDGAYRQLVWLHPVLPMHDIPDITYSAYYTEGEATFGGHNTYLQLLRIFGLLMGGVLIICYVYMTSLSYKELLKERRPIYNALYASAVAYMVSFCLTGTASMLVDSSLLGFGVLGIAYRRSNI